MELPYELVDEVLTRVPVKYLLHCRCVSKGWYSFIDSTIFVEKYSKVSIERNRSGLIIQGSYEVSKKYLLADLESFDDGSAVTDLSEEVGGILNGARVIGSANGLVCLSISGHIIDSVLLFNPYTRKCKKLPIAGTEFLDNNNVYMYMQVGFGYDHVGNDYNVVLLAWCNLPTEDVMAIVYSLKKDLWTPILSVFSTENILFVDTLGAFADGALLWRGFSAISKNPVVVGFDLDLEQFTKA